MRNSIKIYLCTFLIFNILNTVVYSQELIPDTIIIKKIAIEKQEDFYDSLKYRANQGKLSRMIYDFLITAPRPYVDKEALALDYYGKMKGKTISEINIKSLEVFGPNFEDTTRRARGWLEKTANAVHTKSNLNTIKKLLLFKVGDPVEPEIFYENERIIRSLPYIKDIKFGFEQDTLNSESVKITVITKDRFSLGVTGGVSGTESAALELYNQNIFGVGHEISFRFVGHLSKQPYTGVETYYKINNIKGKFIDISAGYLNTYRKEGFTFILDKPFITPSVKWGYGANALRLFRTDKILENDPIQTEEPLDLAFLSAWAGRSFQIKPRDSKNAQMVLSAGFYNRSYYQRPINETENKQYFSNSTFYLAGITFTQRRFIKDQLVYSYGITEDIPEGFKNEIVYGYDANEFGNRHYAHIYLSNGNLLINRSGYLYLAGGIGGYFNSGGYEQGQIQGSINFISRQIHSGNKRFRLFSRANYMLGVRRFEIEKLYLKKDELIRGFSSREALGKQRLSLNLEYVMFLKKDFQKFNMAFFGFTDIGVIGSNKKFILSQNYYTGLGLGMRLHNENLVFKTIYMRLAFYPFHPTDNSFVGFILDEQSKQNFYSFEPAAPKPLPFE